MVFSGVVVRGDGIAAGFGFPTANLDVDPDLEPGVYAVWVTYLGERLPGILCYGPLRSDGGMKCEVHILDAVLDLYGKTLEVELVGGRISEIQQFADRETLQTKIQRDVELARTLLSSL